MTKQENQKNLLIRLMLGSGLVVVVIIAATLFNPKASELLEEWTGFSLNSSESTIKDQVNKPSVVLPLAFVKAEQRQSQLQEIAGGEKSLDRSRARYLLACDLLKKYEGGLALRQLEGLERNYPVLAPYILLKRGRAYQLTNENSKANQTWLDLIKNYPESPAVAEALSILGNDDPKYWEEAIADFPSHPRTHEIVRKRLERKPHDFNLLLLLAKYDRNPSSNNIRDRLVTEFSSQLSTDDWEAIASGYWQNGEYTKAATAYLKAPGNPHNLYRAARGMELNGNTDIARVNYQRLFNDFHDAKETGLGLRHLANLSSRKEAIAYLNIVIQDFPDDAPDALIDKAKILDKVDPSLANQTRQNLLKQYPNSDAAIEYRWEMAQKQNKAGNIQAAREWLQPIIKGDSNSSVTPKAVFWLGKWSKDLGYQVEAKTAFEYVLAHSPQSYYAWRSAVLLGWQVGDFTTVRQLTPQVNKPTNRPLPPAGSEAFKELYLLGQDEDATNLFQAEIGDRQEFSVSEQFTTGLLQQLENRYQESINNIWSLKKREEPRDREEWKALRETPAYWQALFPFPYYQIILNWSQERKINPLLVTALIRQESTFEAGARSPVGATGLMQVMPATAKWIGELSNINSYSLVNPEDNVKLGTWYFDHTHDAYDNNSLFAVASYNAGPGNVSKWRKKYSFSDPDVFVENIPYKETKGYVESVFGNYWNYLRIYDPEIVHLLSQYHTSKSSNRE